MEENITRRLISFALETRAEDIPAEYLEVQKRSLTDAVAVMQAATGQSPVFPAFAGYAAAGRDCGSCTAFSLEGGYSPEMAAFVNGSLSHAMDLEDTCQAAALHSNAVTTPALMALAQYRGGVSGEELLTSLLIGSEIACRISIACGEDLSRHGWYMPPVFGAYGAVLAGCRLLGCSPEQALDALAACAFSISGSAQMIDDKRSQMRAVRDGFGARAAVQAVLLACQKPQIGFENVFEGQKGFFKAYARAGCRPELLTERLGEHFYASGLVFKFWPACLGCHTSIQSTLEVMKENSLSFEDILSVRVRGSDFVRSIVVDPREVKNRPLTAISAKFSLPYCMGLAARKGRVELVDFQPENIRNEDIYSFAEKVSFEVNRELREKWQGNFVDIVFHTTKGDFMKHREAALGDPSCPLTAEQFADKFRSCMSMSANRYSEEETGRILSILEGFEKCVNVNELMKLM